MNLPVNMLTKMYCSDKRCKHFIPQEEMSGIIRNYHA